MTTFFADENITPRLVQLLEVFDRDNEIRAHKEYFEPGTPDQTWITDIGNWSTKPVILGGDGRILKNPAELAALKKANLTFLILAKGWTSLAWSQQAWMIIECWPRVVQNVARVREPSIFEVTVNRKVTLKSTLREWR